MVKEGKSKYTWNDAVLTLCSEWENQHPQSQSSNENTIKTIDLNEPDSKKINEKEDVIEETMIEEEHQIANEGTKQSSMLQLLFFRLLICK